jgi:shikimate 5-dehydrogenase
LALQQLGFVTTMLGRSLEPVREWSRRQRVGVASLSTAVLTALRPAVVLQATPVGGLGRDPAEQLLPDWVPEPGAAVLDMVYQPHTTAFLAAAQRHGATAIPGVAMFLAQAAAQVQLFTQQAVPADVLRSLLAGTAAAARG